MWGRGGDMVDIVVIVIHPSDVVSSSLSSCCSFIVVPVTRHCRHSTRNPPHKQLLMRLEVGGVVPSLSPFLVVSFASWSFRLPPGHFVSPVISFPPSPVVSPFFSCPSFHRPHNPPCKGQGLFHRCCHCRQ